ncbi:hypothetical protein V4C53_11130 [Paraburkholderia azotifigens]|uniref:hypothetical protein n=1 Tax=Paraburkholderia azotifigens TaxID=2057004 RepID=UPI00317623CC
MHHLLHQTLLRSLTKPTPEELDFVIERIRAENPSVFHSDELTASTLGERVFINEPSSSVPMKAALFPRGPSNDQR